MPLFDAEAEKLRKLNLKNLEDKRIRFAEKLDKMGFKPEKMLFCSTEKGSFVALARHNGMYAVIVSPEFGQEGDFRLELMPELKCRREDFFEKGTGLNGMFGFGKKSAKGLNLVIELPDGSEETLSAVAGRTSYLETNLKRNPLLKTARRRGDANIIWDFAPFEMSGVQKVIKALDEYYLA